MIYSTPQEYNPKFTNKLPKVSMVYPDSSEQSKLATTGATMLP